MSSQSRFFLKLTAMALLLKERFTLERIVCYTSRVLFFNALRFFSILNPMNTGSPKAIPSVGLNSKGTACLDASVKVAEKFQSREE